MSLPTNVTQLKAALTQTRDFAAANATAGGQYMKMGKDGTWTFGTDELEVEEGSRWAVNPASFVTGFSAFSTTGERMGEEVRAMTEPAVTRAELPDVGAQWKPLIGFSVQCVDGADEGETCLIHVRSQGGLQEATKLLEEVLTKVEAGDENCVAVISLENGNYRHKSYGKIYTPVFAIGDWVNMDGESAPAQEALPEPEPESEPKPEETNRRRRRKK